MELEAGMYVRTKNGMIAKIISKEDVSGSLHREEVVFILDNGNKLALHSRKVIKASYNIIDLIKVGDYVNGYPVLFAGTTKWDIDGNAIEKMVHINRNGYGLWLKEENIEKVITKEQMSQIEYRIGE